MIKKYVRKPIVVEAMQYTGDRESYLLACDFTGEGVSPEQLAKLTKTTSLYIEALNGLEYVPKGDYIIKHLSGDITCYGPGDFKAEYAEVLGKSE